MTISLAERLFRDALVPFIASFLLVLAAGCTSNDSDPDEVVNAGESEDVSSGDVRLLFDPKELSGEYYFGDGLGVNCSFTLKPNHRFAFTWHGCLGTYDENQGRWKIEGDVLVVTPERPNKHEGFQGMNIRFVPVKWGARHYLIDENEMPGFCAAAGSGELSELGGMRGDDYVNRDGEKLPPVDGDPLIPDRFKWFFDHGPLSATVDRIDETGRVILDRGTADGLATGMLLAASGHLRIEARISSANEHNSEASVSYYWNSDRRVSVGDTFTTGKYFNRPRGTGFERFREPPAQRADP